MQALDVLERHCRDLGRDPASIRRSVELTWTADGEHETLTLMERYVRAGFSDFCLSVGGYGEALRRVDEQEALRRVDEFARGFVPKARRLS
jgi:hypothetical protein